MARPRDFPVCRTKLCRVTIRYDQAWGSILLGSAPTPVTMDAQIRSPQELNNNSVQTVVPSLTHAMTATWPRACPVRRTGGHNRATRPAVGKLSGVSRRGSCLKSTGGIPDTLPPRRLLQHLRMLDNRFRVVFETCRLFGASGSDLRNNRVALIALHIGPP